MEFLTGHIFQVFCVSQKTTIHIFKISVAHIAPLNEYKTLIGFKKLLAVILT